MVKFGGSLIWRLRVVVAEGRKHRCAGVRAH